jgi:hypothetical protein
MGALPITAAAQTTASVAPTLIPVSGQLLTAGGEPRTGNVLLVISLYEDEADLAPRWIEHQAVTLDAAGRYSVNFGSTRVDGLPTDLFTGADATRWIGVAVENEAEQPRVTLISVPYAAKAASADTLSGRTATDFVLTSNLETGVRAVLQEDGVTSGASVAGTLNYVQKGNGSSGTTDSAVFESGGKVGIGTTAPGAAKLKVQAGGVNFADLARTDSRHLFVAQNDASTNAFEIYVQHGASTNRGFFNVQSNAGGTATSHLYVHGNGNVGIGLATPQSALHLGGRVVGLNSGTIARIDGNRDGGNRGLEIGQNGTGTQARIYLQGYHSQSTSNFWDLLLNPNGGSVGIGTAAPLAKLHVAGDVRVDGNIGAKYQDVAEWVDSAEPLEAGSLVVIDLTATNRVAASRRSYDGRVAGAVSAQPGIVLGEAGEGRVLVAQSGRVKVKADARYGAIKPGDLLVSSPTKGHVMRSRPVKVGDHVVHRPGTIVGKALEGLPKGAGEILVLLTLQ